MVLDGVAPANMKLPLSFVPNGGQADGRVRYLAHAAFELTHEGFGRVLEVWSSRTNPNSSLTHRVPGDVNLPTDAH